MSKYARTYDCPATLTDLQVLEFCKNGFLMFAGVVTDEINRRTIDYLDDHPSGEPSEILLEDWFMDNVICHPQAAGAVRSLLGHNFGLPILMSNHRVKTPLPAQNWHRDGGSQHSHEVHYLQVFYYPQECTLEMGPTALLPGSHFLFSLSTYMGHYGGIKGTYYAAAPAGSIFITMYSIWHRRSASTVPSLRNLLKYNYFRITPPQRDWIIDPDFDFATADYELHNAPTFRQQFQDCNDSARMFLWLCGKAHLYNILGGQSWPIPAHRLDKPFGVPEGLG
jgi:hypothetical protein